MEAFGYLEESEKPDSILLCDLHQTGEVNRWEVEATGGMSALSTLILLGLEVGRLVLGYS